MSLHSIQIIIREIVWQLYPEINGPYKGNESTHVSGEMGQSVLIAYVKRKKKLFISKFEAVIRWGVLNILRNRIPNVRTNH